MEITVRFPNLGFLFEYEDRTFSVLGFDITIYGILMAVSLLIGLGMILLCARWQKLNLNLCLGASISALVGGVIGGRLYYIAFSWSQFSGKSWKILCDIRSGGMSIYGAILGGVLVAALLPAQQNVILENGRYCMYGTAQRTDNRCMGKLF